MFSQWWTQAAGQRTAPLKDFKIHGKDCDAEGEYIDNNDEKKVSLNFSYRTIKRKQIWSDVESIFCPSSSQMPKKAFAHKPSSQLNGNQTSISVVEPRKLKHASWSQKEIQVLQNERAKYELPNLPDWTAISESVSSVESIYRSEKTVRILNEVSEQV